MAPDFPGTKPRPCFWPVAFATQLHFHSHQILNLYSSHHILSLHPSLSLRQNGVLQMYQEQNVNSRRRMQGRCGTSRRVLRGTLAHQDTARFGQNGFFQKTEKIHRQNTPSPSHWPKITAQFPPQPPQNVTTPWVLAPPPRSRIATFGVLQPP